MKKRTCPYCNYRYTFRDYFSKLLFKLVWDEWTCKGCTKIITFNAKRRLLLSLGFGIWVAVIMIFQDNIAMTPFLWFLTISLLITGSVLIFAFDTFEKVKQKSR